jgi:hypothetical protein
MLTSIFAPILPLVTASPPFSLGKPKGTIQSSMYDKDKERIQELLSLGVPQNRIVETHLRYGTTKSLSYYIQTRQLKGSKIRFLR